jgi:GNAT superfamily N-acetyltransferase
MHLFFQHLPCKGELKEIFMRDQGYAQVENITAPSPDGMKGITRSLTRAFETDPAINWVIRKDGKRREAYDIFFTTNLSFCLQKGEVFHAPRYEGASLWYPFGKWKMGLLHLARIAPSMVRALGLGGIVKGLLAMDTMEKNHPEERHYYLDYLGVDPEHQGKGIGAALVKPVLDRCDREGCMAYLVNSNPRNFDFYSRQGFQVLREVRLGKGSPPVWPMWRKPR